MRGKPFPKGNSFGKGRPLIPEDLKAVRKITPDEAERLLTKLLSMTSNEIKLMVEDPQTPVLHKIVCKIIEKAAEYGDTARMDFLFARTVGRALDKVQVTSVAPFVIRRPTGEVIMGVKEID